MSISANRHVGIRAALCSSVEMAELSRLHNDANILVLGARFLSVDGVLKTINRRNHRDKLNAILKKMDAGDEEVSILNEGWLKIVSKQQRLAKKLHAINESLNDNSEMCALMESIGELRKDFDGFHMGGSCWLVISKQGDPDQFIKDIKGRAKRYNKGYEVILSKDILIVTQTKLSLIGMQPYKKSEIANWLRSKGHGTLI